MTSGDSYEHFDVPPAVKLLDIAFPSDKPEVWACANNGSIWIFSLLNITAQDIDQVKQRFENYKSALKKYDIHKQDLYNFRRVWLLKIKYRS